ncbi:methionine aminopeptidase 1 [Paramuricea clavata]|uniref:Methionine aminopeptidase n=1 Tax=Paramuricea clavata TaxID=317549 RepID=A0A7D9IQG0_PARCT|nr:methionine aminopeptidase 1 [Paramuricea clavata]
MANEGEKVQHFCSREGCENQSKLQCPTCLKQGIEGSYFCSQDCFKNVWNDHKKKHKKSGNKSSSGRYDPWPGYRFSGQLRPARQSSQREVPAHIEYPDYAETGSPISELELRGNTMIKILNDEEIKGMSLACKLGREVLDEAAKVVKVGVTTDEIDRVVHEACLKRDCYPSPLNYHGFPKSCCTSVNEVICHGIPDKRALENGDILNIDVTVYHNGFHGDLNETFLVGDVDEESKKLVKITHECLDEAIKIVKPGIRYREVGNVIQKHANNNGLSVVRTYCGHGIHRLFHTAPNVPHYSKNKAVGVMKKGHVFTIEPMINMGTWRDEVWPDNWTAVTQDGKRSAQFEQTLLVTDTGCDILTRRLDADGAPYFETQSSNIT